MLLGRLGDDRLRQLGRDWQTEPRHDGQAPGCLWFEQTRLNVCDQESGRGFRTYWETHGLRDPALSHYGQSLALFGLPLTAPRMETNSSGDTVLTQWFERARFEWHPNNPEQYRVLLGLLGNEVGPPTHAPPPETQPTPRPGVPPASEWDCPPTHPVKGNNNSRGEKIYHVPGSTYYSRTKPEVCFASPRDAEAAGYRPPEQ